MNENIFAVTELIMMYTWVHMPNNQAILAFGVYSWMLDL